MCGFISEAWRRVKGLVQKCPGEEGRQERWRGRGGARPAEPFLWEALSLWAHAVSLPGLGGEGQHPDGVAQSLAFVPQPQPDPDSLGPAAWGHQGQTRWPQGGRGGSGGLLS